MKNKVILPNDKSRAIGPLKRGSTAHTNDKEPNGIKNNHLWLFISGLFFFLSLALSVGVYFVVSQPIDFFNDPLKSITKKLSLNKAPLAVSNLISRRLDGVMVEPGEENLYPIAIVIDNHSKARPPSGLARANFVIEAPVEGGITRYLAFFARAEQVDEIGPIRSARPYFIDWAREFSALYTHVGGSPEALVKMKKENVLHINEFYHGDYFWRGKQHDPPHNVYTSSKNLRDYLEKKELSEGKYFGWEFKDDKNIKSRPATSTIAIGNSSAYYRVDWQYDRDNNTYKRFLANKAHQDANGEIIRAKNVIIQRIASREIDELLRLEMDHIGTGTAMVCLDGECADAIWQKKSAAARTRFFDIDNNEFLYNRGTTWIQVVGPETKVIYLKTNLPK